MAETFIKNWMITGFGNGFISNTSGLFLNANTGITVNSSGVFAPTGGGGTVVNVAPANGIMTSPNPITGSGNVYVVANTGLVCNSSGLFLNANSGIVANSTGVFSTGFAGSIVKNSAYMFKYSDVGTILRHTDTSNYNWTIDVFSNTGIGAGQTITGTCENTGTITIVAPTGGSLVRLDGTSGTGNSTIGQYSMFTIMNLDGNNVWGVSGSSLS